MSKTRGKRLVRAVARRLSERDQRQMRTIDKLVSAVQLKRTRPKRPRRS